ncbi:MAG: DUF362 domain-containing protein [Planctomycetota bacterium]|jgi:uncharacterized protein (DUF362 family)
MHFPIDRRRFIKTTAATGASLAFFTTPGMSDGDSPTASSEKSRVVEVYAPGVMIDKKKPDEPRVKRMVEEGMLALTGKKDQAAAWRCFVKPDDVVGLKVNGAAGRVMVTHRSILEAVVEGVKSAGVKPENIILWDQIEEYLHKYYLKYEKVDPEALGIQVGGCSPALRKEHYEEGKPLPGFETEPVKFPWGEVKVAEFVQNKLTAVINLPIVKDHVCSGVTLALKNISHAVVNTPWFCHENNCDPYIADICGIPAVKDKLRLHILDGLMGMADGGPPFKSFDVLFKKEKLLFSTDPVAIDSIGLDWVVKARKEMDMPTLEEAEIPAEYGELGTKGRPARHIATAAQKNLGTNDPARMEIVKVDVPEIVKKEEPAVKEGS